MSETSAAEVERRGVSADGRASSNGEAADDTDVLGHEALDLQERSSSPESDKESLQDHLDAALSEIEDVNQSNKALHAEVDAARCSQEALHVREAGLLEAERAATADADALRAWLTKASVATETAAAATAAVAAATSTETKPAAHPVKAGRETATARQRENQAAAAVPVAGAAAVAAAAKARELETRKLEEMVARLQKDAEEELSEAKRQLAVRTEEAAAAAAERDAWAARSGEWEWEAGRLAGEVEALRRKATGLENELEAAVATARDLEARLREVEDGAVATAKCREAELGDQLGAAQSLLEVTTTRTSPICELPPKPESGEGEEEEQQQEEGVFGSSGDTLWHSDPGFSAEHRETIDLGIRGSVDRGSILDSSSGRFYERKSGRNTTGSPDGAVAQLFAGRRRCEHDHGGGAGGGVGCHGGMSSRHGESGEHACHACGAPVPSFRKLLDCRLRLDRARAEVAETRARAALKDKETAAEFRKAESAFAAVRERLERRLAAAEGAAVARGEDAAKMTVRQAEQEMSCDERDAAATRQGEIAALRTRLRLAEEDVQAARREALLEEQARSLAKVEAARKKAAQAFARAEALRDRCARQERTIATLASSLEEEAETHRAARNSLAKERSALGASKRRVQELEVEVTRLASLMEAANNQRTRTPATRDKEAVGENGGRGGGGTPISGHADAVDFRRVDGGNAPELGRASSREAEEERERGRRAILALEGSLHAAREEAGHHRRRVVGLRKALRDAQHRGDQMEAAVSSARAVAGAERAAAAKAAAEAEAAAAGKHDAKQDAIAAERRQRRNVEELREKLSRATAGGFEAREELAAARKEASRLRKRAEESDRRATVLERDLALITANLHEAEAAKVRALVEKVSGRGVEAGHGRADELVGCRINDWTAVAGVQPPAPPPSDERGTNGNAGVEAGGNRPQDDYDTNTTSTHEVATLRARLAASQAQHSELVRASEEAVRRCRARCEARVCAVLAAGRLAAACSRRRGLAAGREAAVEAGARLGVVRRCFWALREEALSRSRDRSLRKQDRLRRWIGEAFEQAGEEIARKARSRESVQLRRVGGVVAGKGAL